MRSLLALIIVLVSFSWMPVAHGAAFFIQDTGAKIYARGGAYVANGEDLATTWLNPACLVKLKGTNFKSEILWGINNIEYRREKWHDSITNDNPGDPIPFGGISSDFGLEQWVFAFTAYGPIGIGTYYPDDSTARYSAVETDTIAAYIQLTAAWQPLSWMSVGFGVNLLKFGKHDRYGFSLLGDQDTRYDVIADFDAESFDTFNWLAGLWFKPWEHLEIGASFVPKVKANLYGTVRTELPDLYGELTGYETYRDEVTLRVWLPDIIRFGIRYIFVPGTDLEFDVVWSSWSHLKNYEIDFKDEILMEDFKVEKESKDVWNFRIGSDIQLLDWFTFRTGYQFEQSSIDPNLVSPGGVETDRHHLGTGMTLYAWGIEMDLAYQHVFQKDLEVRDLSGYTGLGDGRGEYKSSFDVFSIGFNVNIGDFYRGVRYDQPPRHRTGRGLL